MEPGPSFLPQVHSPVMAARTVQLPGVGILGLLAALVAAFGHVSAASAQQDIEITLESLGIEGSFRPGDWTPVNIALTSNLDDTSTVLVSFEIQNSDGDIERYTRQVVLAPGQTIRRWLYPHLPPSASAQALQNTVFTVRVYENNEGVPGRELASAPVSGASALRVGRPIEMSQEMIMVVGSGRLGLQGYATSPGNSSLVPSLNERSEIINVQAESLPDRWQGLAGLSTIIWSDASPQALGLDEATAIRNWVKRGGRLVILLPESTSPWGIGVRGKGNFLTTTSEEGSLLPERAPTRLEEVRISSLMQVLSKSPENRNPDAKMSIRLFEPEALSEPWEALAALPDEGIEGTDNERLAGGVYAIQRRLGYGWMVLVGIDADAIHRRQLQADGLPQPDVFWNRLIGRRGTIPTTTAYRAYADFKKLATRPISFTTGSGKLVLDMIRIGGPSAGLAMLITFGLFVAYWMLAGPLSFIFLRSKGQVRLSWLGFVCIATLFTVMTLVAAWTGRRILQSDAPVRHLTFLDMISGQPEVRATSWFSAYLPGYGTTRIEVPGEKNLLATWSPPPSGTLERFPNSDAFQIRTDSPNAFEIPTRATSAHFVSHWSGELDKPWDDPPNDRGGSIVQTVFETEPPSFEIGGVIRHGLPWTLEDVQVISISPFHNRLPGYYLLQQLAIEEPLDALPNPGIITRRKTWAPGEALDLGVELPGRHKMLGTKIRGDYSLTEEFDRIFNSGANAIRKELATSLTPNSVWEAGNNRETCLEMYAFFDMLPQPIYMKEQPGAPKDGMASHFQRQLARQTDCSDWFLRPCVLISAKISDVPLPVPLRVNGEEVESSGTVMLRWLHPLPVDDRFVPTTPNRLRSFQAPPLPNKNP